MKELPIRLQDAAISSAFVPTSSLIHINVPDRLRSSKLAFDDNQTQLRNLIEQTSTMSLMPKTGRVPNTVAANLARHHHALLPSIFKQHARAYDAAHDSVVKLTNPPLPAPPAKAPLVKTVIRLEQNDTTGAAVMLQDDHPNDKIAILNMANPSHRGGGWLSGSQAQEEDICNTTTLYRHLPVALYPITDDELIYSPDVLVLRTKSTRHAWTYDDLPANKQFYVDVISCAAVRSPARVNQAVTDNDGTVAPQSRYANDADTQLMLKKLNSMINAAIQHGVNRLVLGAFGCGVFANPIRQVASMMRELLVENVAGHIQPRDWGQWGLKEIVIAVFDPAAQQPVWNGFMAEFREGNQLHTTHGEPVPEQFVQYTTFPPNYVGTA